ncbi:MAG TPA: hypothetical protein VGY31_09085 [Terriglobia bacterium]|nr:hypothetical protein [Terriglobia bacterium]
MPDEIAAPKPPFKQRFFRAAIALLFSTILMIPKLRRLRRNARLWMAIRAILIVAGAILLWRAVILHFSAAYLLPGIILLLLGALVRARPVKKPVDAVAAELNAIIVVSGGVLVDATHLKRLPEVNIFVNPARLIVLTHSYQRLEEIALASIESITRRPADQSTSPAWDLEITWQGGEISTRFRYEGAFAAHLAEIAETTLRQVWKKSLPVITP